MYATQKILSGNYELIILDVNLPGKDGIMRLPCVKARIVRVDDFACKDLFECVANFQRVRQGIG